MPLHALSFSPSNSIVNTMTSAKCSYARPLLINLGTILKLSSRTGLFIALLSFMAQSAAALDTNPLHRKDLGPGVTLPNKGNPPGKKANGEAEEGDEEDELRPEGMEGGRRNPLAVPAPTTGNCPLPTLEAFVQISSHGRPQVAPNGALFFVSDMRESPQLYTVEGPMKWPRQLTFFPDGLAFYSLSPDGKQILLAADNQGNEEYDVFLFTPATSELTPLVVGPKKRVESFVWAEDGQWFAFTSNARNGIDFDLYKFDLKTKTASVLSELKGHNTLGDISPDGKHIAYVEYFSVTDSRLWLFEVATNKATDLTANASNTSNGDPYFTRDSKSLFFLSDREKGIGQAFLTSITTPYPTKPLTSEKFPVESLSMDRSRSALVYVTNRQGMTGWGGFEVEATGAKRKLLIFPPDKKQVAGTPAIFRKDGRISLFFSASSPSEPSNIYQWTHPKQIAWTRTIDGGIPQSCYASAELVYYPSFDGMKVPAYLYLPAKRTVPMPFLLYVHGGPEAQYRPSFSKTFQYFLSRGFGILAPNVRGSTGFGREFTMMDNYKKRMDSVQDAVKGAEWLVKQGLSANKRVGIYGGSYGGFMVLRSIQVEPEIFGAASESVGISNFVTFLKNTKPYRRALREVEYGPLSDEAFLTSISPQTYLKDIKTPLQIFHGANDPRVPASESEELVRKLKEKSIPVELRVFPDEGHGNKKLRNIMEQTKLTAYFFEQYLMKK